jgi:hypothetical protein
MKSSPNQRFVVAQTYDIKMYWTIADAESKRPNRHLKPFVMEIGWRLDWILANIFRKRQFTRATAKASYFMNILTKKSRWH